jgi:hypothetical protein
MFLTKSDEIFAAAAYLIQNLSDSDLLRQDVVCLKNLTP